MSSNQSPIPQPIDMPEDRRLTIAEIQEFNAAADAFFMRRGLANGQHHFAARNAAEIRQRVARKGNPAT